MGRVGPGYKATCILALESFGSVHSKNMAKSTVQLERHNLVGSMTRLSAWGNYDNENRVPGSRVLVLPNVAEKLPRLQKSKSEQCPIMHTIFQNIAVSEFDL